MTHFMLGEWIGPGYDHRAEMGFPAPLKFSTRNAELRDVRKQSREAWATRAFLGKRTQSDNTRKDVWQPGTIPGKH